MVEETEYDDVVTCKHSYSEKCHTTYTTDFQPQQEEKCDENFRKNCFIEYRKVASEETVTFCHTPIILVGDGEEVCQTVYESACTTRYEQHDVNDDTVECETIQEEKCEDVTQGYTTEQKCTKWPVKKCKTSSDTVKKYSPETECKKVHVKYVDLEANKFPGKKNVSIEKKPSSKKFPMKPVIWNLKENANMSPSLFLFLLPVKNVLIFQRRFALDLEPTQEKYKNQSSRNGAMYQQLSLVLPNPLNHL